MSYQIKCISGICKEKTSSDTVFINSNQDCIFDIKRDDNNPWNGTEEINWSITDRQGNIIAEIDKTKTGEDKKKEMLCLKIPPKLAGPYSYFIKAKYLDSNVPINDLCIQAYCNTKIVKSSYKTDKGDKKIVFGNNIAFSFEAEGLHGAKDLEIEIYFENKKIDSVTVECDKGNIYRNASFKTKSWLSKVKKDKAEKKYKLTVKIKQNEIYIPDKKGTKAFELNIDIEDVNYKNTDVELPDNDATVVVNMEEAASPKLTAATSGFIELVSSRFNTKLMATNDCNTSSKDEWVLKDIANNDSHWVCDKYIDQVEENKAKPDIIPVVLLSTDEMVKLNLRFNIVKEFKERIYIKIADPLNNFDEIQKEYLVKAKEGKVDNSFNFEFKRNPFEDTIQYFREYRFNIYFSIDGTIWTSLDMIKVELYCIKQFAETSDLFGKKYPETLLRIICNGKNGSTIGKKERNEILEAVFAAFEPDSKGDVPEIIRVREGEERENGTNFLHRNLKDNKAMGYWRGISHIDMPSVLEQNVKNKKVRIASEPKDYFYDPIKPEVIDRPVNNPMASTLLLLKYGEARCGEWTDFLKMTLSIIGIDIATVQIRTDAGKKYYGETGGFTNKSQKHNKDSYSYAFSVKDAFIDSVAKNSKNKDWPLIYPNSSKFSIAQGNSKAQPTFSDHIFGYDKKTGIFYDPSYGVSCKSSLDTYCKEFLNNVAYQDTKNKSFIATDVKDQTVQDYVYSDNDLFDK